MPASPTGENARAATVRVICAPTPAGAGPARVRASARVHDEHISREEGLALFDAFASKEKSLHVNSGKHKELPRFEVDSAVRFFARHFGRAVTSPA